MLPASSSLTVRNRKTALLPAELLTQAENAHTIQYSQYACVYMYTQTSSADLHTVVALGTRDTKRLAGGILIRQVRATGAGEVRADGRSKQAEMTGRTWLILIAGFTRTRTVVA